MSLLEIKNLCKEFEGVTPLKNIDLTVEQGEVISIIGPSGTGKGYAGRNIHIAEKGADEGICSENNKLELGNFRKRA